MHSRFEITSIRDLRCSILDEIVEYLNDPMVRADYPESAIYRKGTTAFDMNGCRSARLCILVCFKDHMYLGTDWLASNQHQPNYYYNDPLMMDNLYTIVEKINKLVKF